MALALGRDWILEINEGSGWVRVKGLSSVSPIFEGVEQDASTIDDEGYSRTIVTGLGFRIEGSGKRKNDDNPGFVDDPGQDILRRKGRKTGNENYVDARIYRRDDIDEAHQCEVSVKWTDSPAGDVNALQEFSFTLGGQGKPEEIAKPTVGVSVTKTITRSAATAGTFTLTVDGQTTSTLPWNATALAIQSALEGLSTVGEGNVEVTGSVGGPFTAVFSVAVPAMSGTGTSLTPSGTITIS